MASCEGLRSEILSCLSFPPTKQIDAPTILGRTALPPTRIFPNAARLLTTATTPETRSEAENMSDAQVVNCLATMNPMARDMVDGGSRDLSSEKAKNSGQLIRPLDAVETFWDAFHEVGNVMILNCISVMTSHPLSVAQLREASITLFKRHQALRCSLERTVHTKYYFKEMEAIRVDCGLARLSSSSNSTPSASHWVEAMAIEQKKPFDVRNGPMWRLRMLPSVKCTADNHPGEVSQPRRYRTYILGCFHHSIMDGLSRQNFWNELCCSVAVICNRDLYLESVQNDAALDVDAVGSPPATKLPVSVSTVIPKNPVMMMLSPLMRLLDVGAKLALMERKLLSTYRNPFFTYYPPHEFGDDLLAAHTSIIPLWLPADITQKIQKICKHHGVTINGLITAAASLALVKMMWHKEQILERINAQDTQHLDIISAIPAPLVAEEEEALPVFFGERTPYPVINPTDKECFPLPVRTPAHTAASMYLPWKLAKQTEENVDSAPKIAMRVLVRKSRRNAGSKLRTAMGALGRSHQKPRNEERMGTGGRRRVENRKKAMQKPVIPVHINTMQAISCRRWMPSSKADDRASVDRYLNFLEDYLQRSVDMPPGPQRSEGANDEVERQLNHAASITGDISTEAGEDAAFYSGTAIFSTDGSSQSGSTTTLVSSSRSSPAVSPSQDFADIECFALTERESDAVIDLGASGGDRLSVPLHDYLVGRPSLPRRMNCLSMLTGDGDALDGNDEEGVSIAEDCGADALQITRAGAANDSLAAGGTPQTSNNGNASHASRQTASVTPQQANSNHHNCSAEANRVVKKKSLASFFDMFKRTKVMARRATQEQEQQPTRPGTKLPLEGEGVSSLRAGGDIEGAECPVEKGSDVPPGLGSYAILMPLGMWLSSTTDTPEGFWRLAGQTMRSVQNSVSKKTPTRATLSWQIVTGFIQQATRSPRVLRSLTKSKFRQSTFLVSNGGRWDDRVICDTVRKLHGDWLPKLNDRVVCNNGQSLADTPAAADSESTLPTITPAAQLPLFDISVESSWSCVSQHQSGINLFAHNVVTLGGRLCWSLQYHTNLTNRRLATEYGILILQIMCQLVEGQ